MKIKIVVSILITLFITACGGSDSKTTQTNNSSLNDEAMLKKKDISIINHKKKSTCESKQFYRQVAKNSPNYKDLIIHSTKDNITCADYPNAECKVVDYKENSQLTCIVGVDPVTSSSDAEDWYTEWYYSNSSYLYQREAWNDYVSEYYDEQYAEIYSDYNPYDDYYDYDDYYNEY